MNMIDIRNLTKDYGKGRGIFDLSLHVEKGICYGFLGPNGAGKTTTIRHLMGFLKPQRGEVEICGMDCRKKAAELKTMVGYLPGETAFPEMMTGRRFLGYMTRLRKMGKDADHCSRLITLFALDTSMKICDMRVGTATGRETGLRPSNSRPDRSSSNRKSSRLPGVWSMGLTSITISYLATIPYVL